MLLITADLLKKAGWGHYTQVIKNKPLSSGYANTIQRYMNSNKSLLSM